MDKRDFAEKIAEWYAENRRNLPWRSTTDPYKIWLSEIILQQTRVNQGLPYYLRFISRFPDVQSLAAATEQEILRLWQGLGYYTRARNLHKCAIEVVSTHKGIFPSTYIELLLLPGVGEYTAAAIASFSNKEPVAVVDGNVFRVIARIFGIDEVINSPQGKKAFTLLANQLLSKNPDVHNQAMMEFGALWCTPKAPRCTECIFTKTCFAFRQNSQHLLPVKAKGKKPRKRFFYYIVIKRGNGFMMKKRTGKDIWQGLYDFLLIEKKRTVKLDPILKEISALNGGVSKDKVEITKVYRHVLSHQTIDARFIITSVESLPVFGEPDEFKFYSRKKIADLPKPVLISRFLDDFLA